MRSQSFSFRARTALVAAIAACCLVFVPSANAAWLATPYAPNGPGSQFQDPSLAILPDQSFAFLYNTSNGGNTTWRQTISAAGTPTTPVAVNEPDGAYDNKVFAAPDGSQNITYRTANGTNSFSWVHVSPTGVIGSSSYLGADTGGQQSSVADSNGTITTVWPGASGGISYVRIAANGTGSGLLTLQGSSPSRYPSIAADGNGNTYVAWSELDPDTEAVLVRVLAIDADGDVSSPKTVATVGSGYDAAFPLGIASSPDGDLLIGLRAQVTVPSGGGGPPQSHIYAWSIRVRAGESSGAVASLPGYPDVSPGELIPTIGNGGRGTMFLPARSPGVSNPALVALPITASGAAGTEIPIASDIGGGQFLVAAADSAGTATVVWVDDFVTDTASAVRLPLGSTSVTPTNLFPGHKPRDLQITTTKYGDVAVSATLDFYGPATPSIGLQYWSNPPSCEAVSAATGAGTTVSIPLKCTSRSAATDFSILSSPANGSVSVDGAGVASYTPNAGFSGVDKFNYTAENPNGLSPGGTVTVTVAAPAIVPISPLLPILPAKKSAKFPKGKIKANKKVKVTLTGVDPGKKLSISWKLKKKTAKGGAISTTGGYATFKSPKKKAKYKVTIKLGAETLFTGTVKVT
jgi:hypothetical protein